jgi:hypothetical protein
MMHKPRLAWALLAEPVDSLVDCERLVYRERYGCLLGEELDLAIAAGELPTQRVQLTAAALVGACSEALVGPLSAVGRADPRTAEVIGALRAFVRRAVGAESR